MDVLKKLYVKIDGIYCEHCVETIRLALRSLDGVESTAVRQNVAEISGESLPSKEVLIETIRRIGYETDEKKISETRSKVSRTVKWYEFLLIAGAIIALAAGVRLIFGYNIFNAIPTVDSTLSYGMLFVTGLLTSIHCVSMCGAIGIYASSESNSVRSFKRPILYNAGRVISYAVIGGIVGLIGSAFSVSATVRGVIILIAAAFMLLMALSMTGLFSFRLPRLFTFRTNGKKIGAFVIGLLNGLMPCGPLQAMQIYALS
ncbi:MAG: sulfite exporter TauE/SafE family protein, partial [Clostridia bacterium]|nr:sulfite exporter TauE/SafE family protein [Clostridia bacterium]